ncbi:head-tail connector protein [Microbacterium sp. 5K110]|uniref:head-tail connector protein n=1 Tax=unclassified Microbacterium TaxID=2609290 RepID=UPI0010FE0B5F|nr:head-tail connector protein [Microbacterium sp. 5K110]TLF33961.1 phage gp6-like head-tail connector protein [Microbacterium sp. 5K110]
MAKNWPLRANDLRKALEYSVGQDDAAELEMYIKAACERVDRKTGRDVEPTRHEVNGHVPALFVLAARRTAKLWWQQDKKGPRARPTGEELAPNEGIGGIDLPRTVAGILADYPPRPGFGA